MWYYEKKLQYPINIRKGDLNMAKFVAAQLGGPDGELAASLRYMSQRYAMPTSKTKGLLTDISTEELAHVEMISTMMFQLMQDATMDEIIAAGLGGYTAGRYSRRMPMESPLRRHISNPWMIR